MPICADDYRRALRTVFEKSVKRGDSYVDVVARELYEMAGGTAQDRQMPNCCSVMRQEARSRANILPGSPPSGQGPNFAVRYQLPR